MKKSLIALATLAAVSGTAMAQSSVTLYGRVDLGVNYTGLNPGVGGLSPKWSMASGGAGASRFGVRGTEDLGGGLKANFLIEAGVAADTGGVTQLGDRNVYVDLSGGFGSVRLGRFLNPQLLQVGKFSAFGTDYIGSGSLIMHVEGARYNNAMAYTTPSMGGFSATVMTAFDEANTFRVAQPQGATASTSATASNASSASGNAIPALKKPINIGLNYDAGPLSLGLAYARNGASGPDALINVGASYNLGVARVMAQWERNDNLPAGQDTAYLIGATAPVGAGLLRVTAGKREGAGRDWAAVPALTSTPAVGSATSLQAFTPANSSPSVGVWGTLFAVGYDYNLSKRTSLYTAIAKNKTNAQAGSVSFTSFQAGVAHTF